MELSDHATKLASPVGIAGLNVKGHRTAGPSTLGRRGRKWRSEAPEGSEHDRGSGYVWNHYADALDIRVGCKGGAVADFAAECSPPQDHLPAPASTRATWEGIEARPSMTNGLPGSRRVVPMLWAHPESSKDGAFTDFLARSSLSARPPSAHLILASSHERGGGVGARLMHRVRAELQGEHDGRVRKGCTFGIWCSRDVWSSGMRPTPGVNAQWKG
jgi:hypothetical protein